MQNTYGLALESEYSLIALKLAPMTLQQAEKARDLLASYGKPVLVINVNAI